MKKSLLNFLFLIYLSCILVTGYAHINEYDCYNISKEIKVVYIFCHGFGANKTQSEMFLTKNGMGWIIKNPYIAFNFKDARRKPGKYNRLYVNLGQSEDIQSLENAYNDVIKNFPNHKVVLVGLSRGAAVILNFLNVCQPNPDNIGGIVLESPFDTYNSLVNSILKLFSIDWIPGLLQTSTFLTKYYFPTFNPNGLFPLESVQYISLEIPILFVHSVRDSVIPVNSSRILYTILKIRGHQHVYLCELNKGNHGKLILGKNSNYYYSITHAFYKKYGLPYDEFFATEGNNLLLTCANRIV